MSLHLFTRQAQHFQSLRINEPSTLSARRQSACSTAFNARSLAKLELPPSKENGEEGVSSFALLVKRATQEDKQNWIEKYHNSSKPPKSKQKFWFKPNSLFIRQNFWVAIVNDEVCLVLEIFLNPIESEQNNEL